MGRRARPTRAARAARPVHASLATWSHIAARARAHLYMSLHENSRARPRGRPAPCRRRGRPAPRRRSGRPAARRRRDRRKPRWQRQGAGGRGLAIAHRRLRSHAGSTQQRTKHRHAQSARQRRRAHGWRGRQVWPRSRKRTSDASAGLESGRRLLAKCRARNGFSSPNSKNTNPDALVLCQRSGPTCCDHKVHRQTCRALLVIMRVEKSRKNAPCSELRARFS